MRLGYVPVARMRRLMCEWECAVVTARECFQHEAVSNTKLRPLRRCALFFRETDDTNNKPSGSREGRVPLLSSACIMIIFFHFSFLDPDWWGSSLRFDSSPYDAYLILGSEVALTDPT